MALPEKNFFTLDEIISRWRFAGCDRATLLDYARRDLIVFSVYLRDLGHFKITEERPEGKITTIQSTAFKFTSPDYKWHSIRFLEADDARRILEAKTGEQIGVSGLYSSVERDYASGTGYSQALYFTPDDLLVTRSERDRFESEHKVNLVSGRIGKSWRWLRDPENQKALGILGAGVVALVVAAWRVFLWWV